MLRSQRRLRGTIDDRITEMIAGKRTGTSASQKRLQEVTKMQGFAKAD